MRLLPVKDSLRDVEGVLDVHDLHIWSLGSRSRALSCHVLIKDVPPSESSVILEGIRHVLADKFNIRHTTVQFEHLNCCPPEKCAPGIAGALNLITNTIMPTIIITPGTR